MKQVIKAVTGFGITSLGALVAVSMSWQAFAAPLEISAAKELIWDQTKGVYEAHGDAKASRGAQAISADLLTAFYDTNSDSQDVTRIIATTNVSFQDGDLTGSGARLDYNVATDFYELVGPNARILSKDGTARAQETLSFDRAAGIIIADQKGEITLADGRLLQGDSITITLTKAEEIKTVTATGNVYVRQQDGKEAYSENGTYDAQTGKALLTGAVKIIDGESILNGQKAEIDFNKGISRLLADEGSGRVSGTLTSSN